MEKECNILEQSTDAALELFRCIGHLVDTSVKNCIQNMPEQIIQLSGDLHKIEIAQKQSLYDLDSLKQQIGSMTSMSLLLENASKANHLLGKQHYDEHIIQPTIRSLFPVLDLVENAYKHRGNSDSKADDFIDAVWSQMQQFLAVYDVYVIKHGTNSKFDPKVMKPIKWILTIDRKLDGLVAESLQPGFKQGNERMLRLETVALFKHQPSQTENVNTLINTTAQHSYTSRGTHDFN